MPHQCTTCGRTFDDGSKEMLSGCPDCDGNKFQFMPERAVEANAGGTDGATSAATARRKRPENGPIPASDASETRGDDSTDAADRASAVDRAAATVREWVGARDDDPGDTQTSNPDSVPETNDSTPETTDAKLESEDSAQASARRDVVSKAELPDELSRSEAVSDSPDSHDEENVVDAPEDENPGLEELREELNSQFESIRIVNPGHYELNLMELYEREEYIISLQEDGKYVIEVPDAWEQTER